MISTSRFFVNGYYAGITAGLRGAIDGFPNQDWLPDGQLVSRDQEGALITDLEQITSTSARLVTGEIIQNGKAITIDNLLLHSDNPSAIENTQFVRRAFEGAGVEIRPLIEVLAKE